MNIKLYTPAKAIRAAALKVAQDKGSVEVAAGVYLNSQESIVADQADFGDEDGAKTTDFTKAPFWITTNDGQVQPIYGVDDKDLIDVLAMTNPNLPLPIQDRTDVAWVELKKLQPLVQGELFHDTDIEEGLRFSDVCFRKIVAGEFCVEKRQW
ncbi:hypothetical protein LJR168_002657 [Pseudoxanthomonas sp. LjRoot168]|uniref:hypothetical protein n=1 Tax=unclassified Pseudoxanthomonas TaxID=2645906 RepID=UPI003ECCCA81